jgi:hypothetical protein
MRRSDVVSVRQCGVRPHESFSRVAIFDVRIDSSSQSRHPTYEKIDLHIVAAAFPSSRSSPVPLFALPASPPLVCLHVTRSPTNHHHHAGTLWVLPKSRILLLLPPPPPPPPRAAVGSVSVSVSVSGVVGRGSLVVPVPPAAAQGGSSRRSDDEGGEESSSPSNSSSYCGEGEERQDPRGVI